MTQGGDVVLPRAPQTEGSYRICDTEIDHRGVRSEALAEAVEAVRGYFGFKASPGDVRFTWLNFEFELVDQAGTTIDLGNDMLHVVYLKWRMQPITNDSDGYVTRFNALMDSRAPRIVGAALCAVLDAGGRYITIAH